MSAPEASAPRLTASAHATRYHGPLLTRAPHCLEMALAAERARVSTARRAVGMHLRRWSLDHLVEDAAVITSELVTNALLHGSTPTLTLHLAVCGDAPDHVVLIAVTDHAATLPPPEAGVPDSDASREGGRGLLITRYMASCWGTMARPCGGKLVWATLAADPAATGHGDDADGASGCVCRQLVRATAA
ncbi:ATP-binding protein [Streptomyces sp. NPDC001508]|uniref:ATP-binding protein n=1 Tax=Streptomyces sp. NPDC001508 TaxID=3154656 RepID=UPI00332CF643